jgi:hypothetical protein
LEGWKVKRKTLAVGTTNHKISVKDYYQMFTSALFLLIGVIILVRSLHGSIVVMALLVGGGFLALGAYRLRFVIKYLKERRKCKPK